MSKGSIWRKWDFHLHTPYSVLNNQFGDPKRDDTWLAFIEEIEKISNQNNIEAIGLTDYFTIEGYKKVKQLQLNGKIPNIFIFPNIEFRIDKTIVVQKKDKQGATNREPKRINMHVLFSSEVDTNDIEEHFLHDIEFIHEEETFKTATRHKLKISNLQNFGKNLKNQHSEFACYDDFFVGCMNVVVDPAKIKSILETGKDRFKGKYLICLAEEGLSLLDWDGQDHAVRKELLQMSHCVFSSNQKTRDFCLGTGKNIEKHIEEFKSIKPCIWGCDAHSLTERFLVPDKNKDGKINFCWVKGDLTWDGLNQILFEPDERIKIQEDSPEPQKSIHTIDFVTISDTKVNNKLSLQKTKIDLNHNLISIIGGRGSGKTAIMDIIASCFKEGEKLKDIDTSFYKRLYGKPLNNNPIQVSLDTIFKKKAISKKFGSEDSIIDNTDIKYITQNHFEGISTDSERLADHVRNLLFERFPDDLSEFKNRNKKITELTQSIDKMNLDIQKMDDDAKKIELYTAELKKKDGERNDCEVRIKEIEEKDAVNEKLNTLTDDLIKLKDERKNVESAESRLIEIDKQLIEAEKINQLLQEFNDDFGGIDKIITFTLLDEQTIKLIKKTSKTNAKLLAEKKNVVKNAIDSISSELKGFENTNKVISDLKQKRISINEEIERIQGEINNCSEKKSRIKNMEIERLSLYQQLLRENVKLHEFFKNLILKFENGKDKLLGNIEIEPGLSFNTQVYVESINDKVNNRLFSETELTKSLDSKIIAKINIAISKPIDKNIAQIESGIKLIRKELQEKLKKHTTMFNLDSSLYSLPVLLSLNLKFNGISMESLSMGQRAIVLLQIILAYDDSPLLIDQPEEDLDNKYIYEQLVPVFRAAKQKRQIIIATHNANLVVNTDSEQIIVADINAGKISFDVGTIEKPEIQQKIKDILEGGKEAFEKREEKYGYKF